MASALLVDEMLTGDFQARERARDKFGRALRAPLDPEAKEAYERENWGLDPEAIEAEERAAQSPYGTTYGEDPT